MIYLTYFILSLFPLAGRVHGYGLLFKGDKLLAKLIIGLGFGLTVYSVTGFWDKALVSGGVAALAYTQGHRDGLLGNMFVFGLKGLAISSFAAFYLQSWELPLICFITWSAGYGIPRKLIRHKYDASQEKDFYAPMIWSFWGEVLSCLGMALGLLFILLTRV